VSGAFSAGGANSSGANGWLGVGITYSRPLTAPIPDASLIDTRGADSVPHCPGIGQADPGYLCLYNEIFYNVDTAYMYSEENYVNGKFGAVIYFPVTGAIP
jgi:hypothetical protein